MSEITKDQAIALAGTKFWEGMPPEAIARFQLSTNKLCMPFDVFQKFVTEALGRPVFTHEFAAPDLLLAELDGTREAPTLQEIIEMIPESKRVWVVA